MVKQDEINDFVECVCKMNRDCYAMAELLVSAVWWHFTSAQELSCFNTLCFAHT